MFAAIFLYMKGSCNESSSPNTFCGIAILNPRWPEYIRTKGTWFFSRSFTRGVISLLTSSNFSKSPSKSSMKSPVSFVGFVLSFLRNRFVCADVILFAIAELIESFSVLMSSQLEGMFFRPLQYLSS